MWIFFDSIDATDETRFGKFVNHSGHNKYKNCYPKLIEEDGDAYICLFALNDIPAGMEIRYSYGISGQEWQKVFYSVLISFFYLFFYFLKCYGFYHMSELFCLSAFRIQDTIYPST